MAFAQSHETYGIPRICRELVEQDTGVCRNTVAKLMRQAGSAGRTPRSFVPRTTDSLHDHPFAANTLNRQFQAGERGVNAWVADITYISTKEYWLYMATVMDLRSRRIIGGRWPII